MSAPKYFFFIEVTLKSEQNSLKKPLLLHFSSILIFSSYAHSHFTTEIILVVLFSFFFPSLLFLDNNALILMYTVMRYLRLGIHAFYEAVVCSLTSFCSISIIYEIRTQITLKCIFDQRTYFHKIKRSWAQLIMLEDI